jgi:DeoR family transcriptional regulator, fructose operon transcriptional repressor
MIPFIRREKILEILAMSDVVYIEDLVNVTGVSDATIRRDLKTLSDEGSVALLSGGAAKLTDSTGEKPLVERVQINKDEKGMIGKYAASLVGDGDFIFIGPGTTENTMIKHLANKRITVVTNGAFHIASLIKYQIDAIILGGRIVNSIAVLSGPSAVEQVKKMHFDKCFIGGSGISVNGVLTTSEESVAIINSQAVQNSNAIYFLADSSKVGKESRFEFARLEKHHVLITTKQKAKFSDNVTYIEVEPTI